ncbi:MAG: HAMP domain-containing histidine kinase, partial [Thermomicrobiaceae bacterium]|nr:HAMP domain-containing histidine kinase [Thermomicrobiaceae bacterium]
RVEEERSELLDRERAARAEAEEAAAVVHRLQLITDAALAHLRLDDLLGELLRRIRALLDGDTASILLLDERGEQLLVRAAIGLEEDVNEQVPVPVGKGFAGTIAATRRPLIIDDLRHAEVVTPILRRRVRSLIGVPLLIEGRAIGVLQVGTIEPHRFTEEDAHLLRLAADRIALAIEHARLFEAEREARAEAQAAVRAREEFLSIASHELKTPLTTVKGYAQLLGRLLAHGDVDPRRFATAVERLTVQVGRLEELVNDLLDVSRIQQGRLQPQPERFDLTELAREVIERFEQSAERKPQHRLVFESDGPVVGLWDPSRIDQVITNLVSNALKYSPQGGEVRVRVRQVDHAAEIAVSDQGIGITPEERQRLFKPFARGDTARQQFGGAGLGLYITAQIVERHGGTIGVESEPGKGSTFTVRLPLAPPGPPHETPTRA